MTIKKAEGQTLLTLLRLVIVSVALLGGWGMQSIADAVFNFAYNSKAIISNFLYEDDASPVVEGRLYVLYYDEHDEAERATRHVYKHYYVTGQEGALGLKDSAGRTVLEAGYQDILVLPAAFLLKEGDVWRFYDQELNPLSEQAWDGVELELAENGRISSDLVKVELGGLFGAADMQGHVLVEPIYEELELYTFAADWAINRVRYEGRYGYIDSNGNIVIDLIYDYAVMSSFTVYDQTETEAGETAAEGGEGEEPAGIELPIVYVLKDGDWGGIYKRADNSATGVDWQVEPSAQVVLDYVNGQDAV